MSKNLLIIFYRNPELGKVKTRLAATLGDANALAIYFMLAAHTRGISESLDTEKRVCYSHHIDKEDNWPNQHFQKEIQKGNSLGERLHHAVSNAFQSGYGSVCVIGSDCFELTNDILTRAFNELQTHDAVLGPAKDGGYYLLGTRRFIPELFSNKDWSTSTVAEDTIKDLKLHAPNYVLLPTLKDVDTDEDLPAEILSKIKR